VVFWLQGELQHSVIKGWNDRTNQNNAVPQIINIDVREAVHERIGEALQAASGTPAATAESGVDQTDVAAHHYIGKDESGPKLYLTHWLREHQEDPAYKVSHVSTTVSHCLIVSQNFLPKLKTHLLARLQGLSVYDETTNFSREELDRVIFQFDRIFPHATARFNYTSYDVRREQDTINVNGPRRDILLQAHEDPSNDTEPHRYWYARVLGIFHAKVFYGNERKPRRMEFLWVRWFGCDPEWLGGPRPLRLDRIGYVPYGNGDEHGPAFGFVDPQDVLRACHLVPAYSLGLTTDLLGRSSVRDRPDGDWVNYYVMRCVHVNFAAFDSNM
jgi:hypothetical protein